MSSNTVTGGLRSGSPGTMVRSRVMPPQLSNSASACAWMSSTGQGAGTLVS